MELASRFTTRFRYVEMAGQSLLGSLSKPDPWDTPCRREKCFPCQSQVGKCMAQGANYTITCMICKENGLQVQYFGETSRTPFDRGLEHLSALGAKNPDSPLTEHMDEDHIGAIPRFEMKVTGYQLRPIERQCEEASRIETFKGHKLLNRRGEWGQNLPPKLTLEGNLDSPDGPKRKSDQKQVKTRSQSNENQCEGQVRNDPGQESSHATGQVQSQDEAEATGPPPHKRRKLPLKCGKTSQYFVPSH